jgi:uncharacterized protein with PIN domain
VTHGLCVRATDPTRQLAEVVARLDLSRGMAPFRRCLRCNDLLEAASREDVMEELPPRIREHHETFRRCRSCGRVYWAGTHHDRMERLIAEVLALAARA